MSSKKKMAEQVNEQNKTIATLTNSTNEDALNIDDVNVYNVMEEEFKKISQKDLKLYSVTIEGDADRAFLVVKLLVDMLQDISQVEIVYAGYPIDLKPNGWFKVYCVEKKFPRGTK